jgi:hypothetical protein
VAVEPSPLIASRSVAHDPAQGKAIEGAERPARLQCAMQMMAWSSVILILNVEADQNVND